MTVGDVDPAEARVRIEAALAVGDQFLDNHWTKAFKETRALLRARLRLLPVVEPAHEPTPTDEDGEWSEEAREALIQEFLASPQFLTSPVAFKRNETVSILDHCVIARCEYGDGDPLRWSPTVVELFMLDFLPRKVTLDFAEVDALPDVLTAWVRFALSKRGLAERFIVETERAVTAYAPKFRKAVTDPHNFGPAKAIANAMRAEGIDLLDQPAVNAWLERFNSLPFEERDRFFGDHLDA